VETGVQVESLLPRVAHRQWTLSLPYVLRLPVVKCPALLKRLEVLLVRAIWHAQRVKARRQGASGKLKGGGVCFWQWFGSRLQLTPHLHLLVPEAVWTASGELVTVPPPDTAEVEGILRRVLLGAKRHWPENEAVWPHDGYEAIQLEAVQAKLELDYAHMPMKKKPRVAVLNGFSLHADTAVRRNDRQGLERLARYGARGPVSECRLKRLPDGRLEYVPKKGSPFIVSAAELVGRLVALVPPARRHLTSWHGVFAANAGLRQKVTQGRVAKTDEVKPVPWAKKGLAKTKRPRLDWASLHKHTFSTDVLRCPTCGGQRRIRALHATWAKAEDRLAKLGLAPAPRLLPAATAPPQLALELS
jgi:hypothetical protein